MIPTPSMSIRCNLCIAALAGGGAAMAQPALQAVTLPLALSYTSANTSLASSSLVGVEVSADGQRMTVKTTGTAQRAGGLLNFGGYPWWITVADFAPYSGIPQAASGDRWRGSGALRLPAGTRYVAARLVPGSSTVYQLRPVDMTGITRGYVGGWTGTMTGTITTDGTRGRLRPANIADFDIHVDGVETRE